MRVQHTLVSIGCPFLLVIARMLEFAWDLVGEAERKGKAEAKRKDQLLIVGWEIGRHAPWKTPNTQEKQINKEQLFRPGGLPGADLVVAAW